ncbi:Yip1 family protein [Oceanobacillus sp. HCA-5259]|uniref:Yip1 family protein n=1 Tax=Oceanobacillus sp. HCA-5259 TaxID=3134661 RepID=UPI0030BE475E
MLVCLSCNHQQEAGKFCGVCGAAMQSQNDVDNSNQQSRRGEEPSQANTTEGNAQVEQQTTAKSNPAAATIEGNAQPTADAVKEGLNHYWSYFLHLLKNPARAFQSGEKQLTNSLINIGLYALFFSLSIYFLGNSLFKSFGGSWMSESLPFFRIVPRLFFFALILIAITFGSALAMTKLAKNQDSFKKIIAEYGSIYVPFVALNLVAVLGGLIGSYQLTFFTLVISLVMIFSYVPVLYVYQKASEVNPNGQKIYFSLATVLLISFICFLLADAVLMDFISQIEDLTSYGW